MLETTLKSILNFDPETFKALVSKLRIRSWKNWNDKKIWISRL